jgi:hypothetical protein
MADFIIFEIDNIIESLRNYRTETFKIYENLRNNPNLTNNSEKEKMQKLSKIYLDKRKTLNKSSISINTKFENLLIQSIQDRKNIIFETTGGFFMEYNPIKWLLDIIEKEENKKNQINHI